VQVAETRLDENWVLTHDKVMKVLILYATNSGGTEMAANTLVSHLSKSHEVELKRVLDASPEDLESRDVVLFGSPSWDFDGKEGQPHDDFWVFKKKMEGKTMEGKRMAIFGLGDSSYRIFTGAVTELELWVGNWKGVLLVSSLRIDKFFYKQGESMEALEKWSASILDALKT
jgi:flavodoxin I